MSLFLRCDNVMSSERFEKSQKLNTKVAFIDDVVNITQLIALQIANLFLGN